MDDEEIIEKALKVVNDEIELLPSHEILSKEMYEHICLTLKEIKNILETKKNLRKMTEWKKGISDKEIEKTDKMIDDLIDMIDDKRDDLSLDFITKLTKYYNNLLKSEK